MNRLSLYYQNVRGLRTKTGRFLRGVCLNQYDIISITETWLPDSVHSSELFDGRYMVWRRDRDYVRTGQTKGGGVLIAVKRELNAVERSEWRSSAEDIWVTISCKSRRNNRSRNIHLCTLYLCNECGGNSFSVQLNNFSQQ